MNAFLSIIIPVYRIKEEYLRACFDSLIGQDMDAFQVIAIDDGSPDDCGKICDEYAAKDPRFQVIHQPNGGVSVARNSGMKAVDTEWITFVDPDDWVEPDHVSTLYRAVKEHDADIYLFDYYQEFAERQNVRHLMEKSGELSETWIHSLRMAPFNFLMVDGKPYEYETNTIWNKMYKASLIRENALYFAPEARTGEDGIFNAEGFQYTDRFYYIHKALYHYRYTQESVTNRFNPRVQYYNEVTFKHYERIIKKFDLSEEYQKMYHARVATRLYSCMRLYYFHPQNKLSRRQVNKQLDATLAKYPYHVALQKVERAYLTSTQKVFVFFLKGRQYTILRWLVNFRLILKHVKGDKLKQ